MNANSVSPETALAGVALRSRETNLSDAAVTGWRRWWYSLTPQTVVGFVTIVGLSLSLFFAGQLAWRSQIQLTESSRAMLHTLKVEEQVQSIHVAIVASEAELRSFLASQHDVHLSVLREKRRLVASHVGQLRALVASSAEQQAHLQRLETLVEGRFGLMDRLAASVRPAGGGDLLRLLLSDRGYEMSNEIRGVTSALLAQDRREAAARQAGLADRTWHTLGWLSVIGLVNAVAVAGVIVLVRRAARMHRFVKVCAWSKNIEYGGEWMTFEKYLETRFGIHASHGISPAEAKKMMGEMPKPVR